MDFVHPVRAVIPGVTGRVLEVLGGTTAELSLSTLARLAGVSVAQASRVMPDLVRLGLVQRRDVPPSALFRLDPEHVAGRAVLSLARSMDRTIGLLREAGSGMVPPPMSVVAFGSFARGEAGPDSDIDVLVVRSDEVDEDDPRWLESLEAWRRTAAAITGNPVEMLEVSASQARRKLGGRSDLWRDIRRDGVVLFGADLAHFRGVEPWLGLDARGRCPPLR